MIRALILFFLFPLYGSATSQPAKPFSQVELLALRLAGQHQDHMERDIAKRGIDFPLDEDYVTALQAAGGSDVLMAAVRKAAATSGSARVPGSSSAPDTQVLPHLLQAAKLLQNRAWPEAEKEIRAALAIEPDNPLLHIDLSEVLPIKLGYYRWTATIAEAREVMR